MVGNTCLSICSQHFSQQFYFQPVQQPVARPSCKVTGQRISIVMNIIFFFFSPIVLVALTICACVSSSMWARLVWTVSQRIAQCVVCLRGWCDSVLLDQNGSFSLPSRPPPTTTRGTTRIRRMASTTRFRASHTTLPVFVQSYGLRQLLELQGNNKFLIDFRWSRYGRTCT